MAMLAVAGLAAAVAVGAHDLAIIGRRHRSDAPSIPHWRVTIQRATERHHHRPRLGREDSPLAILNPEHAGQHAFVMKACIESGSTTRGYCDRRPLALAQLVHLG